MASYLHLKNLIRLANIFVFSRTGCFFPYMRLRPRYRDLVVTPKSELVIEGYPRSANTFAVAAFTLAQERAVTIAHHLHASAQIIRAVSLGLPTLVLVRDPSEAVASLMVREGDVNPNIALLAYRVFYSTILPMNESYVVVRFEEAISNFGAAIQRVNERYKTNYELFEHSEDRVKDVYKIIEDMETRYSRAAFEEAKVARPSAARRQDNERRRCALEVRSCGKIYKQCQDIYEKFASTQ